MCSRSVFLSSLFPRNEREIESHKDSDDGDEEEIGTGFHRYMHVVSYQLDTSIPSTRSESPGCCGGGPTSIDGMVK